MRIRRIGPALTAFVLSLPMAAHAAVFRDVLDTPAKESALAAKGMLNGVASAGKRMIAVGQRGHIVYSDDGGKSWKQAAVPVSSDLVAVAFPTPQKGWAVGHDGVVLHTADAGATWRKQLDGRSAGKLMADWYADLAAKGGAATAAGLPALAEEAKRVAAQGAENPFLDVWFADENTGYIVGAFNLIFRTADGGKTWEPWFHRTDNPGRLHLYAIRQIGSSLFISGEQGLLLRLDDAGNPAARFTAMDAGYKGSWFGITGQDDVVVAFGLRGNVFRSADGGKSWRKVDTGLQDGVTGGASCGGGRMVLVSQSGRLLVTDDAGEHFRPVKVDQPMPASAVLCAGGDAAVIAGARGMRAQTMK